jgi:uncharacterized protein YecE (DUF72 family)
MIHIGTSGFSYQDWEKVFYPVGLPATDRLAHYAGEFDTVEVDFSYYRVPTARTLAGMARKTPPTFLFAIKAHQEMTHQREDNAAVFAQFREALQPWLEENKLGCILAQFPSSFRNIPANRDYLRQLRERLGELPVTVEFRHREWLTEEVFALLHEARLGYCAVDQPPLSTLLPPIVVATAPVGYVRFHGRNAAKWWQHEQAWERYNYTYTPEELAPWVPKIAQLARETQHTFVYTNNHWQGQAVDTARQLRLMLGQM